MIINMTVIKHKRGDSTKWSVLDPILEIGEIGYESDTGNFKIGNGSSPWSSLPYFIASTGEEVIPGTGTVTSVDMTVPTGLVVSGNPITADGTLAIAYDTDYAIPTTIKQGEWDTAYGWGDHAAVGYVSPTTNSVITLTNNTSSTSTTTGALKVTGGVGIQENLNVGGNIVLTGNLTVNGTTTTLNSTVVTVDDPIFTLGGDTAPGSDDNKDRGIAFRWHNGATAKIGFFGFDDSAQQFTFIPDATITSEVISGTAGIIAANLNGVAASANELSTPRYIWGQTFDGTDNVSGSLTDVGDITSSDAIFSIGTTSVTTALGNRINITGGTTSNTIGSGGYISLTGGSATASTGENFGGDVDIAGGASTLSASGTGGSVSILAGNGNTKGTISIGTSNTSGITIGASGITTTIVGTLSATLNALTISSPLSGTSYNGSSAVTLALSTGYGDSQNPYGSKVANYVLAGPVSGPNNAPTFRTLATQDIPDLSGTYVTVSGNQSISGTKTFTANPAIQIIGNSGLSIGRVDGTASVNYIDFNNGATVVDYDTRIYSSGGTGTSGQGDFNFYAASSTFNGSLSSTGILYANGGTISSTSALSVVPASITTTTGRNLSLAGGASTSTGIGNGGDVSVTGGAAVSATTASTGGTITITGGAGNSTVGLGGDIVINAGAGSSGNNGVITIGGSNTKSLTIGAAGITTTVLGTLAASFSTLTINSPLSGTSYNGSSAVSIGLSTGYGDTQNPYAAKAIKTFLAGPAGGVSGSPIFRVLETTDIPDLSATYLPIGGNAASATSADTIDTVSIATNASFYPTFVNSNNGTAAAESLYTDAGLAYNPSTNTLTATTFSGALSGNATSANTLSTARDIWGQSFNGSGNVTGNLTSVGNITGSTAMEITAGTASSISLRAGSISGTSGTGGAVTISSGNGGSTSGAGGAISIDTGTSIGVGGAISIGTSNASSVTIGRSSITTTIPGKINLSGSTAELQVQGSPGASGTVLTSAGAGATPTWQTPSSSLIRVAANRTTTAGGSALAVNTQETATTVTFPASRFTVTPSVVANTSSPRYVVAITSASSTGFTMIVRNVSDATGTTYTWNYQAIEIVAGMGS
jgi:hypothetical protein